MSELNTISEASYLTTGNTPQYRRIMRCFYKEYEKMNYQLDKESLLELVRDYSGYENYDIEQLKSDLNMLVEWKNLTPLQDPRKVYTIEDYKNKQFRYSMSEAAVEIERMTVKLENLFNESGSLSSNYIRKIEAALYRERQLRSAPLKELNEWWNELQEDFRRLNQNYQDYLREFYSEKSERLLKTVEFVLHKDLFITYLREFIGELQTNSARIEGLMRELTEQQETNFLERVIESELKIPRLMSEEQEPMEEYIRGNVYGKWRALKSWFITAENRQSESSRVLDITDEIIRKIIQNAALIVQLQNWGVSRKDDYRKFISLFLDCGDINEAHRLAAHVFGIQHIRHYKVNSDRSTDSINSSVYEEEPSVFFLKPRTRSYRPKLDKAGFENKALEKHIQRQKYLERLERERKMVMRYIKGNRLALAEIEEPIPVFMRQTLLRWIEIGRAHV